MSDLPTPASLWATFALASLVLSITPGPGVAYIVTRTLTQGRNAGLASVAGVALGNLANATLASLGLATVCAASTLAFSVVKFAGAAYLLWLGWQAVKLPSRTQSRPALGAVAARKLFIDGAWVALLNPKTALFFAAFLPQFIDPHRSALSQSLTLGVLFVAIAATTDASYVLTAGVAAPWLTHATGKRMAVMRYLSAGVYIGLAVLTLVSSPRLAEKG